MERRGSHLFFAILIVAAINLLRSVECEENKRIIIYVPSRVKTIHHHHHHVVLMDPQTKTVKHAKPHSDKQMVEAYHKTVANSQREYQRQQHYTPIAVNPYSYTEQRKTIKHKRHDPTNSNNVMVYPPPRQLPVLQVPPYAWPNRNRRSKVIARLHFEDR
ncbi:uncharacterized protein LOC126841025 [Adelges cooleyi]|uniref:uncharacterized protein LOC126841025 n=1 Tax=Adelges cooleyi TaxID=133065 RepID=UPI00217F75A0|nr:uncharacterized protein LOC126841025 [Adelges cooleyi]